MNKALDITNTMKRKLDQGSTADVISRECFHCGQPIEKYSTLMADVSGAKQPVCCHGCKAVAEFIDSEGMRVFYDYRGQAKPKQTWFDNDINLNDASWQHYDNETVSRHYINDDTNQDSARFYIDGIYCSSCAWLINKTMESNFPHIDVALNVDTHHLTLAWDKNETVALSAVLGLLSRIGYQARPLSIDDCGETASFARELENRSALRRLIVAGLGMMQVMTYAIASYLGNYQGIEAVHQQFLELVSLLVATLVVFYSGKPFFLHAIRDIRCLNLSMDVPVALAVGAAYFPSVYHVLMNTGAAIYFDSAVMFVFFLSLGRYLEMRSRYQGQSEGLALTSMLPDIVSITRTDDEGTSSIQASPHALLPGDRMSLSAGDNAPCDGVVITGSCLVNMSLLTGESEPLLIKEGDVISAGSKLVSGAIELEIRRDWQNSALMKVQRVLDSAQAQSQMNLSLMDKLANVFIVSVLVLTAVVAMAWWFYQPDRVFEVSLAMLIASCPCAFSLAAPVVSTMASKMLRDKGILLVNLDVLQRLKNVTHWCFDKTGTLSKGRHEIVDVQLFADRDKEQCLTLMAALEQESHHLIANALTKITTPYTATDVKDEVGNGVTGKIDGRVYWCGRLEWVIEQASIVSDCDIPDCSKTLVALAESGKLLVVVWLEDRIKMGVASLFEQLHEKGKQVSVISGDRQSVINQMPQIGYADNKLGDMQPEMKVQFLQQQQSLGDVVAMIGDGINDAPVLAQADVSLAMASGSEISQSQADIILLNGKPESVNCLYQTANHARNIVRQNVCWALGYNLSMLPLAAAGMLQPWMAALGMSLSSLVVVMNARRLPKLINDDISTTSLSTVSL